MTRRTYCNPMDLDYGFTPIPNFSEAGRHRATADPCIAVLDGTYYLFSTNQWGYWWSEDLADWTFVPRRFLRPEHAVYDELCAPAAWVRDGALHVLGSTYTRNFPIWVSRNPRVDDWVEAVHDFGVPAWDPAFLLDDDDRLYLYYGSSNTAPLFGVEIDPDTWAMVGEPVELVALDPARHGWERFGEHADDTFLRPFIEGAWMTKHAGRYYLQYGAPATEFSGYADGVHVGEHPLGPFTYQEHNPVSYRPGGFARGAGHGGTFQDVHDNHWHVSTIVLGVKNNFERRNGLWPAGFDEAGRMYAITAYGDYPTLLPDQPNADHRDGRFAGWMLLSGFVPATASSWLGSHLPSFAVDESMRTWWSAASADPGEWLTVDLGQVCTVHAIQVNYADQDATVLGKGAGLRHRFVIEATESAGGQPEEWQVVVDRSESDRDSPHAYVELDDPVQARRLRITNVEMPTGRFALSGFRAFGIAPGAPPAPVADFVVLRADPPDVQPYVQPWIDPDTVGIEVPLRPPTGTPAPGGEPDRRRAWVKWRETPDAAGHVVYWGVAPDALYSSAMVYTANELWCTALDRDTPYWFAIEAFNASGIGPRTPAVPVP